MPRHARTTIISILFAASFLLCGTPTAAAASELAASTTDARFSQARTWTSFEMASQRGLRYHRPEVC